MQIQFKSKWITARNHPENHNNHTSKKLFFCKEWSQIMSFCFKAKPNAVYCLSFLKKPFSREEMAKIEVFEQISHSYYGPLASKNVICSSFGPMIMVQCCSIVCCCNGFWYWYFGWYGFVICKGLPCLFCVKTVCWRYKEPRGRVPNGLTSLIWSFLFSANSSSPFWEIRECLQPFLGKLVIKLDLITLVIIIL